MTEVITNYNFKTAKVRAKDLGLELDAPQAAEVDAILKAAASSQLWKSMEKDNYGRSEKYNYGSREDNNNGCRENYIHGNYGCSEKYNHGSREDDNYGCREKYNYRFIEDDNYGRREKYNYGSTGGAEPQVHSQPVNKSIPKPVMEAAEFAVRKHNEGGKNKVEFISLLDWYEWEAVAGWFYALLMSVKDGTVTRNDRALVFRSINGPFSLIWWLDGGIN